MCVFREGHGWGVNVRIKKTPVEREIDGVPLDGMIPGTVRNVSAVLGSWLITKGYADFEMRRSTATEEPDWAFNRARHPSTPRERRARKR